MAGVLVLIAVIVAVVGGTLGVVLWRSRARLGRTELVLLAVAGGSAEAHIWGDKLRGAGINPHVRQIGDLLTGDLTTPGGAGSWGYQYEVWVRPRDEAQAREVLGL